MDAQGTSGGPEGAGSQGAPPEAVTVADTGGVVRTALRPNSMGLVGATMQAITHIAPAIAARFLTSWMYVLYSRLSGGPIYGFFGFILAGELRTHYDISAPWLWWVCILVGAPTVAFLQYRGIK